MRRVAVPQQLIGQSIIDLRKVGEADEEAGVVRAGVFSRALL